MQDEHCCLLIVHFGGRKVNLWSQLKAKLNRFSYSAGLLWHQLSPCDPLRIYVPHDTDSNRRFSTSSMMHHQAVSWAVRRHSYACQMDFGGHTYTGG